MYYYKQSHYNKKATNHIPNPQARARLVLKRPSQSITNGCSVNRLVIRHSMCVPPIAVYIVIGPVQRRSMAMHTRRSLGVRVGGPSIEGPVRVCPVRKCGHANNNNACPGQTVATETATATADFA